MDLYPLLPQDPRFQSIIAQNPLFFATSPLLKITRLISRGISITASQCVILVPVHRFINMAAKARFYRGSPTFFNWRSGDPSSDRKHRRTKVFAVGYENRKLSRSRARIEGKGRNFTVPRFLCVCVCMDCALSVNGVCALGQGKPASLLIFRTSCEFSGKSFWMDWIFVLKWGE